MTGSWYLFLRWSLSIAAALKFDVLGPELFHRLPVVEPRGVAEIDPEPDLGFVAHHRVEHEHRRVAELQRDLVVISAKKFDGRDRALCMKLWH